MGGRGRGEGGGHREARMLENRGEGAPNTQAGWASNPRVGRSGLTAASNSTSTTRKVNVTPASLQAEETRWGPARCLGRGASPPPGGDRKLGVETPSPGIQTPHSGLCLLPCQTLAHSSCSTHVC